MTSKSYLRKKDNTWHVVVEVPPEFRKAAGKARFKKSLGTDSLTEANRLKLPWVAEFLRLLAEAKAGVADPKAALMQEALEFNHAYELTSPQEQTTEDGRFTFVERDEILSTIKERASAIADKYGNEVGLTFLGVAEGSATPVANFYSQFLAEFQGAEQTRSQHRAAILEYIKWAGQQISIEATDRKKAGEYIAHRIKSSGLSRRTIERHKNSLSSFWKWLVSRGHVENNPWTGHSIATKSKGGMRKGLTDEKLLRLLKGTYRTERYAQTLRDLMRLALLHGARLDELCSLRKADVHKRTDGYWLVITDGKTEAATREIPVHKLAVSIIKRRLNDNEDEYLFGGLEPGGPDRKRSWYVSKAYGRFRKQDDVKVDARFEDFHALRHTFTECMEGLEVPESTVKLLIGHKRKSMTYGRYSTGQRVNLRNVINKLKYARAVMAAIAVSAAT